MSDRHWTAICDEAGHILVRMPGTEYGISTKSEAVLLAESILAAAEKAWPEIDQSS